MGVAVIFNIGLSERMLRKHSFAYNSIIVFLNSSVLAPGSPANDAPPNDVTFAAAPVPSHHPLPMQCHYVVHMS